MMRSYGFLLALIACLGAGCASSKLTVVRAKLTQYNEKATVKEFYEAGGTSYASYDAAIFQVLVPADCRGTMKVHFASDDERIKVRPVPGSMYEFMTSPKQLKKGRKRFVDGNKLRELREIKGTSKFF